MLDFIKKNPVSVIIISLLFIILLLNLFPSSGKEEMSFDKIKDYANELRSKGLYQQAIDAYEQYLKDASLSKKTKANTHYFIGEIYRDNIKDFDKALAHFIKIKYIYPDTSLMNNINQKIIECLENSGRSREAQLALEESTSLNKQKKKEDTVILAKIDSDIITLSDFNDWFFQLPDNIKKEFTPLDRKKILFRQFIGNELMYRMAFRKGFQNDPEIKKKAFEIQKSLMAQKLMRDELVAGVKVSPGDIDLYYKANQARYKKPFTEVYNLVQQDFMQEKIQEKQQELINRMVKANSVQIFDGNLR